MISSKELVDNLIVGSITSFSPQTMRLLDLIENNQQVPLNDVALNDPDQLSVAIFNYPIIKDDLYKEFSEAAKRISSAKYAYYKKSAAFKDNFTKLCTETFNKHHQSDVQLSHLEQIQKVRSAIRVIKFIGELYVADFFINCNIAHFLEVLSKNIVESKVSQDCLECLISIISNRVKNEVKLYKHNIHTAAIINFITDYENETSKIKRNYKDLEIIEAVNKTIKNKSLKGSNNRYTKDTSRSETVRQTKKIFETILSGNMNLLYCVETAYDVSIIFPDSFENEMLQLCFDYIKKSFEAPDENLKAKCMEIVRFIGMLYSNEALTNDGVKGTINFLYKFDSIFSEPLTNVIFAEIYDKVMDIDDVLLKQVIPENFVKISNGSASEKELEITDVENEKEEVEVPMIRKQSTPDIIMPKNHSICESTNVIDPIEKFKELLIKLSPTNVAYILRETSGVKFSIGEDMIKELATHLIEHAVNKPILIKSITQVAVKLPDTIVPHFNTCLMKKHLRALISSKITGCSERESVVYGQLIKELHSANYYDRFDIIILLDNFTENFNHDRTALTSLLQFIDEFKDILIGKKLSKNMKQKLINISSKLSIKMSEESDEELMETISNAIKTLNSETRPQSESSSSSKKEINNNYKINGDMPYYRSESNSQSENSSPSPIQLPPMHLPPPKMFIPPPNFVFVASKSAFEIMENRNSWPSLETKEKHQMSFKTVVDTKSDDDFSIRQSGSTSSVSISLQEIEMESDEFYDTASNAESFAYELKNDIESESAYSSLIDARFSKEDIFKNIIRCQFSYNNEAIESFATLFIKRGMKSKNSGYMDIIEEIRESLTENEELFAKFTLILEQKFIEFIQNLPKADVDVTKSDKRKHLQLILLIGEYYNMGFMKNQTFIACLEKLLNDIGTDHQITLFHQLIKISFDKIIQNGITNVIKTFMDMLAKKLPTIVDANDRNLAAWELYVTMKILIYRQQKAQMQCPVTYFKLFISNLNEESIVMKLEELKYRYCYKKEQIAEIVEFFLLTAISSFQTAIYVKLANELHAIKSATDDSYTFQKHMEFKLHDVIKNILNDIENETKMIKLFNMTSFVGDLFVGNVASIYLVLCILEMLLEKEVESKKIVDCIKILLQKVGYKIDLDSVLILDKFFLFFKEVIKCDKGYRRVVFKELIDLRMNKWNRMENERNLEVIEELFGKLTHANFIQVSFFICGILSKNFELIELFVKLIWKLILNNPESVLLYAKLSSAISNYNEAFRSNLMLFMKHRNETFKTICCEPIVPGEAKLKLSSVMMFMSYLYAFDFCEDDDIGLWIHPSFTKQLTMGQCNEISHILGTKINESKNNELLRAFVALMEFHSRENLFAVIKSVKNELSDLPKSISFFSKSNSRKL
ncbi:unnamed protein product [Chironomus riparius]|uniref:Uncharacterized protein n=1 Tax=Chironomus riparius TaxID=315576 RepID=A0A9N9RHU0_9DIPT|nr:unnamed protein product [Chironomus riparius]